MELFYNCWSNYVKCCRFFSTIFFRGSVCILCVCVCASALGNSRKRGWEIAGCAEGDHRTGAVENGDWRSPMAHQQRWCRAPDAPVSIFARRRRPKCASAASCLLAVLTAHALLWPRQTICDVQYAHTNRQYEFILWKLTAPPLLN